MHERDDKPQDNFVMSGQYPNSEERDDNLDYAAGASDSGKKVFKPLLIAGIVLLVAVIVLLMFLSGSPRSGDRDQLKNLEARLKQIEEKLAKLDWIDTGMARLDRKEKDMGALSERLGVIESGLNRKIDQLARDVAKPGVKPPESPAPKTETAAAKPESPAAPKPAVAPPAKTEPPASPSKAVPATPGAKVEKDAKPKTHVVQPGETLFGISRKYDIPVDQLLKLNRLTTKDPIKPGQKLVIGQ
jgi:LysM repeat protein